MFILTCNSILYWLTFFYFYKKDGMIISSLLWLYYAIFSTFGALLMINGMYFEVMGISDGNKRLEKLSFEPYILLYLTFYFFVTPFRQLRTNRLNFSRVSLSRHTLINLAKICCFFEIIYILVKLYQFYLISQIGFGVFHDMQNLDDNIDAKILYGGALGIVLRLFNYIGRFINLVFMPTIVIYVIYLYCNKSVSKKLFLWIISTYILGKLLVGMVGGSRGTMFFAVMELIFYYILFRNYIDKKIKRKVLAFSMLLGGLVVIITMSISIERNDNIGVSGSSVYANIFRYLGEMWPNLGLEYWDRVNIHPYGELLFNSFNSHSGNDNTTWFFKTGVHTWWFYTILGRLYVEYGKLIALIIIFAIVTIIRSYLKRKEFYLYNMGIVVFIYNFCISSLFNLIIITPINLFCLIALIILSHILKSKRAKI